ncbi:MAG: RNA methyltransferase [Micropruina sp.]
MITEPLELPEPSQATLRGARQLLRRQHRKETGRFLAEGPQAVREALKIPEAVESVFLRWSSVREHLELLEAAQVAGVPYYAVSEQNLATMSDTVHPQGVTAVVANIDVPLEAVLHDAKLIVICAQVRDPGNAGTVIRCADAFGADAVILSSDSVEVYNPKTVRSSVGSIFHLPIVTGVDLVTAIDACRAAGLQIFATDGESGVELTQLGDALARPTAWVMGNESWGLPVEHVALADQSVAVPIYGQAESLNLATAAAVVLYASASAQRN